MEAEDVAMMAVSSAKKAMRGLDTRVLRELAGMRTARPSLRRAAAEEIKRREEEAPKPSTRVGYTPKKTARRKPSPKAPASTPPAPAPSSKPGRKVVSWSAAELSDVASKYGDTKICTKCGKEGDILEDFGLRRMSPRVIRPQAQCRECRRGGLTKRKR